MYRIQAAGMVLGAVGSVVVPNAEQLDAVAKWPLTAIFAAGFCFMGWLLYKTSAARNNSMAEPMQKVAEQLTKLNANLAERPCIRSPEND